MSIDLTNDKIILKFSADWCGPCVKIEPYVKSCEEKHTDIVFHKINVENDPDELVDRFSIKMLPTFICLYKNNEVSRYSGIKEEEINKVINVLLNMS
jgi:thioredoxin 1